ncbi:ISAzo13-like element transposase-related protein [Reyranella sp.]|uniref:ISAzo13-like element transposase-related protein n=1 Tax=Reyranella sp. TaxID=1929291 RepID=UPI003D124DB9
MPPARRERRAAAALRWSARRPGLRAARSAAAFGTSTARRRPGQAGGSGAAAAARLPWSSSPCWKTRERCQHPDRYAQFDHINARIARFRRNGQPAISVDTKKASSGDRVGDSGRGTLRDAGR